MIPQAETIFKIVGELLTTENLSNKKKLALQRYFVHKFVPLMTLEGIANMSGHKCHITTLNSISKVENDPNLVILKRKIEMFLRKPSYMWDYKQSRNGSLQ